MTVESKPMITVIIAVYNCDKTLSQCLDSVFKQNYPHKELIVIDGSSNDGTVQLLIDNQESIKYWISEPDRGIYNAWNKALAQAKGEWICFLGADDFFWEANGLERMSSSLNSVPDEVKLVYGQVMLLNHAGDALFPVGEPWPAIKKRFAQLMCIPHPGAMHRRSLFDEHGAFDESFNIAGDYELLLRDLKSNDALFVPNITLVGMRHGGVSSDPRNALKALIEVRRAQRMHGANFPGPLWLAAMLRVYVRLALFQLLGVKTTKRLLDAGRRLLKLQPIWTKT